MVQKSTLRKIVIVAIVFFAEIFISLSDKAITMGTNETSSDIAISRKLNNQLSSYKAVTNAETEINAFLEKWNITGASVAVMKDERLIYAKGFGTTQKTEPEKVQPKHLFRIASISKLITSTAIMRLVEENELALDQKVFGNDGILNQSKYLNIKDNRVKDITIYHLLTHSGGWAKSNGDPVFMPYTVMEKMNVGLPVDLETTIEYTLQHRTLDFKPGSRSSYSNFGYAVLGKVIEKTTGMGYENYVVTQILNPLNIYDMHLGSTNRQMKFSNEVNYYSNSPFKKVYSSLNKDEIVLRQYGGNNFDVLGAAGAWVATPVELLKFLAHIDGNTKKKDILTQETIQQMINTSPSVRPIGWIRKDKKGGWMRTGTLTGTSALLKKGSNGISWVMVLNTSNTMRHDFTDNINSVMTNFIDKVDNWPDYDLFNYKEPSPLYAY
ncbi:MAG: serine hydrolase domain-containing protein [Bacteroidota bacterium]